MSSQLPESQQSTLHLSQLPLTQHKIRRLKVPPMAEQTIQWLLDYSPRRIPRPETPIRTKNQQEDEAADIPQGLRPHLLYWSVGTLKRGRNVLQSRDRNEAYGRM